MYTVVKRNNCFKICLSKRETIISLVNQQQQQQPKHQSLRNSCRQATKFVEMTLSESQTDVRLIKYAIKRECRAHARGLMRMHEVRNIIITAVLEYKSHLGVFEHDRFWSLQLPQRSGIIELSTKETVRLLC